MPVRNAGFTLIEILVVIAIFAVMGTLGLIMSMDTYRGYSFHSEETVAVSVLEKARNESMVNLDEAPHGVHIASTAYTIFEGANYASRVASLDQIIAVQPDAAIAATQPDIVFAQLSGNVTDTSTITIVSGGKTAKISINSEGGIMW